MPLIFRDVLANIYLLSVFKRGLPSEVTERPIKYESVVLCEPRQMADPAPIDLLAT